ncbi:MAG TPA: ABC transporter permease, partial [Acidobacteriaceae bacterium]|nr:ABC transporter permease [Acidobacteriaceae bacterium]
AKVAAVPGVTMAALSTNATPPANGVSTTFLTVGRPSNEEQTLLLNFVSEGYFSILRIPLAEGRIWDATENRNGAGVVVINQTLERMYFPKGDAVGQSVKLPEMKEYLPYNPASPALSGPLRIVGVIEDKLNDGLDKPVKPEAFVPDTILMRMNMQILVRSEVSPLTLLNAIQKQVSEVNVEQQTQSNVKDLEHWITGEPEWQRGVLISWLFSLFAVLALVLAAVGLYSTVAYAVAQRTNEFGIRMALGAQREHVLGLVFRATVASVAGGVGAGLVLALALNRALHHWAGGSAQAVANDPLLLLGATALLGSVAALASLIPARRASHIDPMAALRCE